WLGTLVLSGWQLGRFVAVRADLRFGAASPASANGLDWLELLSWLPLVLALLTIVLSAVAWRTSAGRALPRWPRGTGAGGESSASGSSKLATSGVGLAGRMASPVALAAWFVLGATAGASSAGHLPPDPPRRTAQLHLVRVDSIESRSSGIGWSGTLHASLDGGTWHRYRVPISIIGPGEPASGEYLVRGTCR